MGAPWLINGRAPLDNLGGPIGTDCGNTLKGSDFTADIGGTKTPVVCGNNIMEYPYGCGG